MSKENWLPTVVVIDDAVLQRDDPYEVIEPVWWTADFYKDFEAYEKSLACFSEAQRLVWAILWYNSEVHNGGHEQFFSNSTGMVWPEALVGLKRIGRGDLVRILSEAVSRFPSTPSRDREEREEQMSVAAVSFEGLDEEFWGVNRAIDLRVALMSFIRQNPQAFFFSGEVRRPRRSKVTDPGVD
jgi:hypothetical protein